MLRLNICREKGILKSNRAYSPVETAILGMLMRLKLSGMLTKVNTVTHSEKGLKYANVAKAMQWF